MTRPTMDSTLMEVARTMARRGTCSRAQVGVAIACDDRVLATAYNGAPRGMSHCVHPVGEASTELAIDVPTCTVAVHAEANAVAFAARHGIPLDGGTLYTTLSPCVMCAQLVVNAGIKTVFTRHRYRDLTGVRLLNEANVVVFTYVPPFPPDDQPETWVRDYGREESPDES